MASKDIDNPAPDLVGSFEVFIPLYRQHLSQAAPQGSSPVRLLLLSTLADQGNMAMAELRHVIGGSAQNVTGLVDALEAEGQVERSPHPTDRRKTLIALTAASRAQIKKQRAAYKAQVETLFDSLSDKDQARLAKILGRLNKKLSQVAP